MKLSILESATPQELLALDARRQENLILEHPVWASVFSGEMPKARLKKLLLAIYPAFAGTARYASFAKLSQIDPDDGKQLFLQIHKALKTPAADADAGWKKVLAALGASEKEMREAREHPSAEAVDLVEVIREHGLRSGPVEAAVVAHMLEQHLPRLWGRLADALQKHYGVKPAALAHLRHEAGRAAEMEKWVAGLVDKYVVGADSYKMYEARRAAREAVWAWTVLTESV